MMIKNDHLWWVKSTYDGWRRLKMLFWRKPALTPTKNYENTTVCVFFQGASDADAKIGRNIAPKLKNIGKLDFYKKNKIEILKPCVPGAVFRKEYGSGLKNGFWQNSKKPNKKYIPKYDVIGTFLKITPKIRFYNHLFLN